MFRGLILGLLLAASQVHAQGISHDARRQASAEQTHAEPKSNIQPSDLSAIKDQIHSIARAIEAGNNKQQPPGEKQDAKRNLAAQEKIAAWAPAVFWVALAELATTLIGVFLVWRTLTETRRIGQAEIRGYVSINGLGIGFSDAFLPEEAIPSITIVAKNFGQSPARKFVWQVALQYIAGNEWRERNLDGAWIGIPGTDIPAGDPFEDRVLMNDMPLVQFSTSAVPRANEVVVRVRITFKFTDVFDLETTDEAYFVGLATHLPNGPVNAWRVSLSRLPKLADWSNNANYHQQ